MIKNIAIEIVCDVCSTSKFSANGDAAFNKGAAYAQAHEAGWQYVSAEKQICPDCIAKSAAAKTNGKAEEKAAKTAKAVKAAAKKGGKAGKVVVKVSPKTNAKNVGSFGQSTGKVAKSAKIAAAK